MNKPPSFFQIQIFKVLGCIDWIYKLFKGERSKGRFSENYLLEVYYKIIQEEIRERNALRNNYYQQGDVLKVKAQDLSHEK